MRSTLGASILGIITLKITTFSVSKLSIKAFAFTALNSQHNDSDTLGDIHADCRDLAHYADCR